MKFVLPELNYEYDDLEPVIDAKTMEIHHSKHHQGYVNNLNKALESFNGELTLESMMSGISTLPKNIQTAVRNNGGGHFNHSLFWEVMGPADGNKPFGDLGEKINNSFGSYGEFVDEFVAVATSRFGSGWAWLGVDGDKKLVICSTANQDNPLMSGVVDCECTPILGVDVWEHAYYLKYQNLRADYVKNWFDVVNWEVVGSKYSEVVK